VIDLHVHSWRCRHAVGTIDEYVDAAAAAGVKVLAFTEHLPLAPVLMTALDNAECYAMPPDEIGEYVAEVAAAGVRGAEQGVEVLLGIEADLVEGALEHARGMVACYPFDVVLGSVHTIGGWAFDDPDRTDGYASWRLEDLWHRYFDDVISAARAGIADVMAHADLIKKFCQVPDVSLHGFYSQAALAFAEAGVAVEINTAGLRKPCAEIYPAVPFLAELRKAGVGVTVGSDAHAPGEVGFGAREAHAALERAGYRSVLVFRKRIAEEVGIDELLA
jgi:histidinol-phosphatase (PHP family)